MADKPKEDKQDTSKDRILDGDAIDAMPLSILPLSSSTLKSARLIKNSRLETSIEIHSDPVTGSLHVRPEDIVDAHIGSAADQEILMRLARLPSYDIYSLRSSLKKLGIQVDETVLQLSDDMKDKLHRYSLEFTHPLLRHIFGAEGEKDESTESLLKLFNDPDKARVSFRLRQMSQKTGLSLAEIPPFLEEYSDVFLSVAYYRHTFQSVLPELARFWLWIADLRSQSQEGVSPLTFTHARQSEEYLRFIAGSTKERLKRFQSGFDLFWGDISKESFRRLRNDIEENHAGMGAVLCGLVVKMRRWSAEFPDNTVGGPAKRSQYVLTELMPGLEALHDAETDARERIGLSLVHNF